MSKFKITGKKNVKTVFRAYLRQVPCIADIMPSRHRL